MLQFQFYFNFCNINIIINEIRNNKFSSTYAAESDKNVNSDSAESPNPPSPTMQHGQNKEQFKTKVFIF